MNFLSEHKIFYFCCYLKKQLDIKSFFLSIIQKRTTINHVTAKALNVAAFKIAFKSFESSESKADFQGEFFAFEISARCKLRKLTWLKLKNNQ